MCRIERLKIFGFLTTFKHQIFFSNVTPRSLTFYNQLTAAPRPSQIFFCIPWLKTAFVVLKAFSNSSIQFCVCWKTYISTVKNVAKLKKFTRFPRITHKILCCRSKRSVRGKNCLFFITTAKTKGMCTAKKSRKNQIL